MLCCAIVLIGAVLALWDDLHIHIHFATRSALKYVTTGSSLTNPNLALVAGGAATLPMFTMEAPLYGISMRWLPRHSEYNDHTMTLDRKIPCGHPASVLHPSAVADRCWCFMGSTGQVGIMLSHPAFITNISLDHIPLRSSLANAPRDVVIWGVVDGEANQERYDDSIDILQDLRSRLDIRSPFTRNEDRDLVYVPLASIFYNIRKSDLFQQFKVFPEVRQLNMDFGIIVAQVTSNWGESFTALHHVGIYGEKTEGLL
ncbi:hypothetical protein QCA50_018319 [Cerrena zonata]|uniref:SUN domain-containing protein n=1 Tax=Cerrena zonata TaxID=2478898 RepID=A0AAW0FHD8_9APHY